MMFIPSRESDSNIREATPECDRIPTPTNETLAISFFSSLTFKQVKMQMNDRDTIFRSRCKLEIEMQIQMQFSEGAAEMTFGK